MAFGEVLMTDRIEREAIPKFLPQRLDTGETRNPISIRMIQRVVAEHFKLPMDILLSVRRYRPLPMARQIGYHLARELTIHSFPAIARLFKNDHSTVIYGCKKIKKAIAHDPKLASEIETIKTKIMDEVMR
jgi:chromosomal replication initiator protein